MKCLNVEEDILAFYTYSEVCLCPGDGGVETAEEAVEPAEPDINELCTDMFEKMAIFLQGELTGLSVLPILQDIVRKNGSIVCLLPVIHFKSPSVSLCHAFTSLNLSYQPSQAHVKIIACWKT